ncbi:MAG: FemAB family PEP-CTERM system-associated protein [Proteobacteria bacterium]|nr:FemAB family PEP-CTERM system-associated protein [Pseudomonadota bacterium]
MEIRVAQESDQPAWDAYVRHHPEGLAYHQFAWRLAINKAYGFAGCYLLAEEQGRVSGVLPLILFPAPFFKKRYISLPFCDVGGVLADNASVAAELAEQAISLARGNGIERIEIRATCCPGESGGLACVSRKVRMVLDLPGDAATLLAGLKAKLRSQVKKPMRDGLSARVGGLELLDDFYAVFVRNMRDLGSPVHSRRWIAAVLQGYGQQARIAVVYTPEGQPAAAGVMLLHPAVVSNPWASSLRSCKHLNPNMLLYWTMLSFAADNGFPCFDFGRSTPGGGTHKFKQQWGAREVPLHWTELLSAQVLQTGTGSSPLRAIAEKLWQHLPLNLTASLGPYVRRHIPL